MLHDNPDIDILCLNDNLKKQSQRGILILACKKVGSLVIFPDRKTRNSGSPFASSKFLPSQPNLESSMKVLTLIVLMQAGRRLTQVRGILIIEKVVIAAGNKGQEEISEPLAV